MNENKKTSTFLYVLKIALPLVAICGIIALLVATVNHFTAPVIAQNNEEALKNAIAELFDGESVTYAEMPINLDDADAKTVDAVYLVKSGEEVKGYCVKLSPACFKGDVDMIVSLDPSAFVTGVKIVSTNDETSGIGTKVTEKSFTEQFIETSENTLSGNYFGRDQNVQTRHRGGLYRKAYRDRRSQFKRGCGSVGRDGRTNRKHRRNGGDAR